MTKRDPWLVLIVTMLLSPVGGAAFINRGRLALIYLGIMLSIIGLGFVARPMGLSHSYPYLSVMAVTVLVQLIGMIHCFRIARRQAYPQPMRWYSRWYWILAFIGGYAACSICLRLFLYEPFMLPGDSMSPALLRGDYIFADKTAYRNQEPKRGDIVVFKLPQGTYYIKRVIGLPGETVQLKRGVVYINAVPLARKPAENAAASNQFVETLPQGPEIDIFQDSTNTPLDNTPVYRVPQHAYFTLGDNRDQSHDSRDMVHVGFVAEEQMVGQAIR